METLLVLDGKNYTDAMPVFEKYTVRALIKRGNLYAMQRGRTGEYKIPGGGMEPGESRVDTLVREVREETGMLVDVSTIRELGEILELREDLRCQGQKYVCHSLYYSCDVLPETVPLQMTESEIRQGFHLEWAEIDTIISSNLSLLRDEWKKRDTRFLQMVTQGRFQGAIS